MWDRGRRELTALGFSPEKWAEGWISRINRGDAVCFDSNGPCAILGCDWESADVCDTSFQASTSFEVPDVGWKVTKEMRRAIPELMKERGAKLSYTYSLCIDPKAEKWFRLLGLEEEQNYPGSWYGPYIMRRFFRRV